MKYNNMAALKGDTRVLRVLQMGGKYGTIDFVRMANVADPHKNIARLKRYGHNITSEWRKEKGTRFKVWQLVEASATQTEDNNTTKK